MLQTQCSRPCHQGRSSESRVGDGAAEVEGEPTSCYSAATVKARLDAPQSCALADEMTRCCDGPTAVLDVRCTRALCSGVTAVLDVDDAATVAALESTLEKEAASTVDMLFATTYPVATPEANDSLFGAPRLGKILKEKDVASPTPDSVMTIKSRSVVYVPTMFTTAAGREICVREDRLIEAYGAYRNALYDLYPIGRWDLHRETDADVPGADCCLALDPANKVTTMHCDYTPVEDVRNNWEVRHGASYVAHVECLPFGHWHEVPSDFIPEEWPSRAASCPELVHH